MIRNTKMQTISIQNYYKKTENATESVQIRKTFHRKSTMKQKKINITFHLNQIF